MNGQAGTTDAVVELPPDDQPMFWDRQGQPLTLAQWSALHRNVDGYRLVARDHVDTTSVITVWLGTDQGFGLVGEPPLIFGTAVMTDTDLVTETNTATEDEALAAHRAALANLAGQGPSD